MRHSSPAQRLGMTANLVIFLGLLYTVLHCLGFLGLLHGYRLPGLAIALALLGLGYGMRYGSGACLYGAMAICAGLSLYFGGLVVSGRMPYSTLRLGLSAWTLWRLYRAIPAMQLLQQEQAFPLPMSRYGELFLRRLRARSRRRGTAAR
jgi:hypothetical protein